MWRKLGEQDLESTGSNGREPGSWRHPHGKQCTHVPKHQHFLLVTRDHFIDGCPNRNVVAHACNPKTQDAEARGLPQVWGQPGLQS